MPIPKVKENEKQEEYISRCMNAIGDEYKDKKQALAICFDAWREKNNKDFNIDQAKVNSKCMTAMKSAINAGRINTGAWAFTAADGNKLLGPNQDNWDRYSSVHLAINPDAEQNTKAAWGYPIGKMAGDSITIFRRGVIAAKAAASGARGAEKNEAIINAADNLLQMIDKKSEKEDKAIMQRFDVFDLMEYSRINGLEEPFQFTDEGYLTGRAIVTNIGVFPYLNGDGTIRHELRLPEEVLNPDSLETLKMKPIANEHPAELKIDIENIKKHQKGYTGSEINNDAYHISVPITITDAETIEDVKNGKRALSAGYSLRLEEKSGTWMGIHYDAIQRDIRYNHVAIVVKGRAGDAAKMRMDTRDNISYHISWNQDSANNNIKEDDIVNLKTINIDGVDYQAEAEVIKTITQLRKQVDTNNTEIEELKKGKSKLEAEKDGLKDKVDQLEKELNDETKIEEKVNQRIKILTAADLAKITTDKKTEREIMEEVIKIVSPKADLTNKDAVYISARFDAAVEILESKIDSKKTEQIYSYNGDNISADKAREKMIARIRENSRGIKEGGEK